MDVQCSYYPPTIPLLSPYYGSTQLRAAQRVHQLACRMADCAVGRNRQKKKQKKKRTKKRKRKRKKNTLDSELQIDIQSLELGVRKF